MDKDGVPDIFYGQRPSSLAVGGAMGFWLLTTVKKAPKSRRHDSTSFRWRRWIKPSVDENGDSNRREECLTDTAEFKIPRTT